MCCVILLKSGEGGVRTSLTIIIVNILVLGFALWIILCTAGMCTSSRDAFLNRGFECLIPAGAWYSNLAQSATPSDPESPTSSSSPTAGHMSSTVSARTDLSRPAVQRRPPTMDDPAAYENVRDDTAGGTGLGSTVVADLVVLPGTGLMEAEPLPPLPSDQKPSDAISSAADRIRRRATPRNKNTSHLFCVPMDLLQGLFARWRDRVLICVPVTCRLMH